MTGRRIVVHQCPRGMSPGLFRPGDVVFFDDCLRSQYIFLKERLPEIACARIVLGFSPGLARPPGLAPIDFMESAAAHAAVNAVMRRPGDRPPDEIRAFMSEEEALELTALPGVEVALHGCMHLKLESIPSRTERLREFRADAEAGAEALAWLGMHTGVFVYPYAFCEDGYEHVVRNLGFAESYARPGAYRTAVEDLDGVHPGAENS